MDPSLFEIRRAALAEANDAFQLIEEYYRKIGVTARDDRRELQRLLAELLGGIWLARRKEDTSVGTAVGCILLRPLPGTHAAGEVKRLYVRQAYRGQGIAKLLLSALEQYARECGLQWLYLDTMEDMRAAFAFYQNSGYTHCERYNDNPQASIFMRKQLKR